MPMKSPSHPGLSVRHDCLEPLRLTVTEGAAKPGVSRKQLSNVVNGRSGISPEMAIRLDMVFGAARPPGSRCRRPTTLPRPSKQAGQSSSNESHPKPPHDYALRLRPSGPSAPKGRNHRAAYPGVGAEGRPGWTSRAPRPVRGRRPRPRRAPELPQRTRLISIPCVDVRRPTRAVAVIEAGTLLNQLARTAPPHRFP